jgi:thioredoxin-like negative regulator of GroEL
VDIFAFRNEDPMVLTLTWLSTAVMAPAAMARRAMKQGHAALARKNYVAARPHLERAARYEPLREEAICLMAEASLYAGKAADALYALNTLLMEQDQFGKPRSARVRLLRGIAGCILGRSAAARRELAAIPKTQASVDELLAAAQACILSEDYAGAQQLLDALDAHQLGAGAVAARVQLCRAAIYYRTGHVERALAALPSAHDCSPPDAALCRQIRRSIEQRFQKESPMALAY